MENKKCNRVKPGVEKRISQGFGAHLLTHERRREYMEHGSCASNASVPSWQFAGYWTLVDDILQNIYHLRSRIGYKRHVQLSTLIPLVVPPLRLNEQFRKSNSGKCGYIDISERKRAQKQTGPAPRYSRRDTDTLL